MKRKILKYTAIFIGGIILALAVAPFIFKGEILKEIKKYANENLNATVDFSDVDVSFLRSFPEVAITVNDLKVMGVDTFYGNTLLDAKALRMDFSLLPLFNKNLPRSIKYIGLKSANLDLIFLNDTLANYLITRPSKDSSRVEFKIEDYELNDCKLKYTDFTLPLEVNLVNLNHKGSGDIADVVFDLNTTTTADSLTLVFDGFTYLTKVKASLDAIFTSTWINNSLS